MCQEGVELSVGKRLQFRQVKKPEADGVVVSITELWSRLLAADVLADTVSLPFWYVVCSSQHFLWLR